MKVGRLPILLLFLLFPVVAAAQFYSSGTDPARARFREIRTENFKVIYPSGADSLAREYALCLQRQYPRVGLSIGTPPSGNWSRPQTVLLHAYHSYSNGMVMWAPRRMELYTVPDAYDPSPIPWMLNLATHESRHASQLQFTRRGLFGGLHAVAGQLSDVAWWAAYPGIVFSEGDAVVAETELTSFGRGRESDFLEYVRACFSEGQYRDVYRWMYGSQKLYTPDHYRAGYLLAAGMRTAFDCPDFTGRYYRNIFSRRLPLPFFNMSYSTKQVSGMKLRPAFDSVARHFAAAWAANDSLRSPSDAGVPHTAQARRFSSFRGAVAIGDAIYAVQTGLDYSPRLVRIASDGRIESLGAFSSLTSDLAFEGGKLYWSEYRPDPRWSLAGTSAICSYDISKRSRKTLLGGGKYYNPAPSPDGTKLAIVEYPFEGGSALKVISPADGGELRSVTAPSGMQLVELAWMGDSIVASAITDGGFGLYRIGPDGAGFEEVLPAGPAKIKQLRSTCGMIHFVCDRNGVNELYCVTDGTVLQVTSLPRGGENFLFNASCDTLRYAELSPSGRQFKKLALSSLSPRKCDWSEVWEHPVASKLASQLGEMERDLPESGPIEISQSKPYRRAAHLMTFHSWLPLYLDYDVIAKFSLSSIYDAVSLGATAFFQNELSTASGSIAYSASPGAKGSPWNHKADIRFNYSGWYPVVESSLQISTQSARQYTYIVRERRGSTVNAGLTGRDLSVPSVQFSTRIYVPFNFSSGGWSRGLVPQIRYSLSNSVFDTSVYHSESSGVFPAKDVSFLPTYVESGRMSFSSNFSASIRGYSVLPTAPSGVYPRLGIGAEIGTGVRPALDGLYAPSSYAYLYGYLPGIIPSHGLRLSALSQVHSERGRIPEQRVSVLPRGYVSSSALNRYLASSYPLQTKLTADYLMAVLPVDWSALCPVAYIRNFELGAHFDATLLHSSETLSGAAAGTMFSAGGSLSVRLGNFLWIPFPTRIGVSVSGNFGSEYEKIAERNLSPGRVRAAMIFSIDY